MKHIFLTSMILSALGAYLPSVAQNGHLDSSFSGDGKIISSDEIATSTCFDANGKILVIGHDRASSTKNIYIKRYNSNGTGDLSFGIGGLLIHDINTDYDYARCIRPAKGGKYLVCGQNSVGAYFRPYVLRLNTNGSLDNTFGNLGVALFERSQTNTDAWDMHVSQSGSVYIAGYRTVNGVLRAVAWKLKANGVVDSSFGSNGEVLISNGSNTERFFGIDLDESNNRLALCGTSSANGNQGLVVLLDTAGNFKTTFNSNGILRFSYNGNPSNAYDVLINANYLLIAGNNSVSGSNEGIVCSYLLNGSLNTAFASGGVYANNVSSVSSYYRLSRACSGNILAAGNIRQLNNLSFLCSQLKSNGNPDSGFAVNGHFITRMDIDYDEVAEAIEFNGDNSFVMAGRINVGSGTTRSGIVKVKMTPCNSSSVQSTLMSDAGLKLYPNPLTAGTTLQLYHASGAEISGLQITGTDGKSIPANYSKNGDTVCVQTDMLSAGIYQLTVQFAGGVKGLVFVVE